MNFAFNEPFNTDEDEYLYTAFVVIGQLLGYCLSITNGYNPDSPSRSHTISRIVSGVKIYPYENKYVLPENQTRLKHILFVIEDLENRVTSQ